MSKTLTGQAAVAEFNKRVETQMGKTTGPEDERRMKAINVVSKRDRKLHQAYIEATQLNPSRRIAERIGDKFEAEQIRSK